MNEEQISRIIEMAWGEEGVYRSTAPALRTTRQGWRGWKPPQGCLLLVACRIQNYFKDIRLPGRVYDEPDTAAKNIVRLATHLHTLAATRTCRSRHVSITAPCVILIHHIHVAIDDVSDN